MLEIRNVAESDYKPIITVLDAWWGGRKMADMLPKLFFVHFRDTSFVVEQDGELLAFLIGFVSQTNPDEAYIHFVGVHPEHRKAGYAQQLYHLFFEEVARRGCRLVRCVTSPVNKGSIAFHSRMGFAVEPGDGEVDGVQVLNDYDGSGQPRVRFIKQVV